MAVSKQEQCLFFTASTFLLCICPHQSWHRGHKGSSQRSAQGVQRPPVPMSDRTESSDSAASSLVPVLSTKCPHIPRGKLSCNLTVQLTPHEQHNRVTTACLPPSFLLDKAFAWEDTLDVPETVYMEHGSRMNQTYKEKFPTPEEIYLRVIILEELSPVFNRKTRLYHSTVSQLGGGFFLSACVFTHFSTSAKFYRKGIRRNVNQLYLFNDGNRENQPLLIIPTFEKCLRYQSHRQRQFIYRWKYL